MMNPAHPAGDRRGPIAALLLNACVWGLSWWPLRELDRLGLHSLWSTALVFAIGSLVLAAWRPESLKRIARHRELWWLGLASGLTNAAFNWGVSIGEVMRVVLLFYLMPVWAILLARWLLDEPITSDSLLRALLAMAGAATVLWQPGMGIPVPASLGDWLGVAGGLGFAFVNVLLRRQAQEPAGARALAMSIGSMLVPAAFAILLARSGEIAALPGSSTGWLAGVLALSAVMLVANLMLQYGAARLPSRITAIVMLSEVLVAAVSSVALGGEALSLPLLAGGSLIILASVLAARSG